MRTLGIDTGSGVLGFAVYDAVTDRVVRFGNFSQPDEKHGGLPLDQRTVAAAQFLTDVLLPRNRPLDFERVAVEAPLSFGRSMDYVTHVLCWVIRCRAKVLGLPCVEIPRSSAYCVTSGTAKTRKEQMFTQLNSAYGNCFTCFDETDALAVAIAGSPRDIRPAKYAGKPPKKKKRGA